MQVLITGACGLICLLWLSNADEFASGGDNQLYSYWAPMVIVLVMAYAVGAAFMDVLGVAIDTILMCVCVDTGRDGAGTEQKPYYASAGLLKALGHASKVSYGTGFERESSANKVVQLGDMAESKQDDTSPAAKII